MNKFLKENGFVKIPKRGKHVKAVYCCPDRDIFVTLFQNGEWNVSKAGDQNLEELESWRMKITEHAKSTARPLERF